MGAHKYHMENHLGAGMYPQMVYHADVRAREMELAADRQQMGCSACSPLGRMISSMITRSNGRERRVRYDEKMDYAMAYAPAQTCYVRPTARTVTLATSNSHRHHHHQPHAVQPEPPQVHATATTLPGTPFPSTGAPPQAARKPKKKKKKKRVRFTPSGPVPADDDGQQPPHHAQHHAATVASSGAAGGTAGAVYHHGAAEPPSYHPSPAHLPAHGGHGYAYGYGRYAPSPLPRWETPAGTPRRHEYFSGEYRWYYPTPVREGIYSIATDANGRLSTIFSEENPNACTIV